MRKLEQIWTFQSGVQIHAIMGGFLTDGNGIITTAWTQSRLVLMFYRDNSAAEEVRIGITAGIGETGETNVEVRVSFDYGDVQYCDITDVLRSVIWRKKNFTIYDTATDGLLEIRTTLHDGTFVDKDVYGGKLAYYDAIVMNPTGVQPASVRLLPDTFRLPLNFGSFPLSCTRITRGGSALTLYTGAGAVVDTMTGIHTHHTLGWGYSTGVYIERVVISDSHNNAVESARVVWEDCNKDKVLLTWWSPTFGGWKSVLADVLGHANTVGSTADYLVGREYGGKYITREWGFEQAKSGTIAYNVRIPSCTSRDYEYYSDIYISDEVYITDCYIYNDRDFQVLVEHAVKVSGNPPVKPINGSADLQMAITTQEVSSIW